MPRASSVFACLIALSLLATSGALQAVPPGQQDPTSAPGPDHQRNRAGANESATTSSAVEQAGEEWMRTHVANPAGCPRLKRAGDAPSLEAEGLYPKEDFEEMLQKRFDRVYGPCGRDNVGKEFCPAPYTKKAIHEASDPALVEYLRTSLEGVDTSKPLIVIAFEADIAGDARGVQIANLICGMERLGLLDRTAVFTTEARFAEPLKRLNPKVRVLHHKGLNALTTAISKRVNLNYMNRVFKLAVTHVVLNLGHDLILTDVDVTWIRDPTDFFLEAAKTGLEFAAMKDYCWLEVNSGFVYYRNTAPVKEMILGALSTWRERNLCADNDQYLVNCAFARAAAGGLNYRVLPHQSFTFGMGRNPHVGGSIWCQHDVPKEVQFKPTYLGDGMPYIWHTAGYSSKYEKELDAFAALGMVDVDVETGRCKAGLRGSEEDVRRFALDSARACHAGNGGILHAGCSEPCGTEPDRAAELAAKFGEALKAIKRQAR